MDSMLIVTIAAIAIAATMSLVAWRLVRDDRQRSEARIARLTADIHGVHAPADSDLSRYAAAAGRPSDEAPEAPRRLLATLVGAGVLVAGSIVAMVMVTSGAYSVASGRASSGAAPASRPPAAVVEPPALELVALTHERNDDRLTLTVRGVVRNPGRTVGARHLSAVVLLFNTDGRFLTSGRVPMSDAGLAPGGEAPFVVTVPGAAEVGRYRVSFRSDDRVVPHVDRRR